MGTAMMSSTSKDVSVSFSVTGRRAFIMSVTGSFVLMDFPKLPCSISFTQMTYLWCSGRFRWYSMRSCSLTSAETLRSVMMLMGSPGIRSSMAKTRIETTITSSMPCDMRLMT